MPFNFFKVLSILSVISSWMKKALEDGRITLAEALGLIALIATELGLPLDFSVAEILGEPKDEAATPLDEGVISGDAERPILKQ